MYVVTGIPLGIRHVLTNKRKAIALTHELARAYGNTLDAIWVERVVENVVTTIYCYRRAAEGVGRRWFSGTVYANPFIFTDPILEVWQ